MKLSEPRERAFRRLFDHYARVDEIRGDQVKSLQAPFEAQMNAKSKMARHRAFFTTSGTRRDGDLRVTIHRGTDIGCGCDAHCGHGDNFSAPDRMPFHVHDQPQMMRPNAVATALRALDGRTNRLLQMLAGDPLPEHMQAFGPPFKESAGERALQRAPLLGVAREPARGPGNLAPATAVAVALWGDNASREADLLARRVFQRTGSQDDRDLARAIRAESGRLAEVALDALLDALGNIDRLPLALVRAGRTA